MKVEHGSDLSTMACDGASSNGTTRLALIFDGLGRGVDRVTREILWKVLEKKGVSNAYIRATQDMYEEVLTSVWK